MAKAKPQSQVVEKPVEKEPVERSKPDIAADTDVVMFQGKMYTVAQLKELAEQKRAVGVGKERREGFVKELLTRIHAKGGNISSKDLSVEIAEMKKIAKRGAEKDASVEDKEFFKRVGRLGATSGTLLKEGFITRVKLPNVAYFYSITDDGNKLIGKEAPVGTVEQASTEAEKIVQDL